MFIELFQLDHSAVHNYQCLFFYQTMKSGKFKMFFFLSWLSGCSSQSSYDVSHHEQNVPIRGACVVFFFFFLLVMLLVTWVLSHLKHS